MSSLRLGIKVHIEMSLQKFLLKFFLTHELFLMNFGSSRNKEKEEKNHVGQSGPYAIHHLIWPIDFNLIEEYINAQARLINPETSIQSIHFFNPFTRKGDPAVSPPSGRFTVSHGSRSPQLDGEKLKVDLACSTKSSRQQNESRKFQRFWYIFRRLRSPTMTTECMKLYLLVELYKNIYLHVSFGYHLGNW